MSIWWVLNPHLVATLWPLSCWKMVIQAPHECSSLMQQHSPGKSWSLESTTRWKTNICWTLVLGRYFYCFPFWGYVQFIFRSTSRYPTPLQKLRWLAGKSTMSRCMSYWKWGNFPATNSHVSLWTQWCNFLSITSTQPNSHLKDRGPMTWIRGLNIPWVILFVLWCNLPLLRWSHPQIPTCPSSKSLASPKVWPARRDLKSVENSWLHVPYDPWGWYIYLHEHLNGWFLWCSCR